MKTIAYHKLACISAVLLVDVSPLCDDKLRRSTRAALAPAIDSDRDGGGGHPAIGGGEDLAL